MTHRCDSRRKNPIVICFCSSPSLQQCRRRIFIQFNYTFQNCHDMLSHLLLLKHGIPTSVTARKKVCKAVVVVKIIKDVDFSVQTRFSITVVIFYQYQESKGKIILLFLVPILTVVPSHLISYMGDFIMICPDKMD